MRLIILWAFLTLTTIVTAQDKKIKDDMKITEGNIVRISIGYFEPHQADKVERMLQSEFKNSLIPAIKKLKGSGNTAAARNIHDTLFIENNREPVSPFFFVLVYAGLNDKEKGLEWLEKAYEEKSGSVRYLKMEPRLQSLRNEPRYSTLMKKIGLEN